MKALLSVLLFMGSMSVYADSVFEKSNGSIEMKSNGQTLNFTLITNVDQDVCDISGDAAVIDDHRAAYTPGDDSLCVVVFNFIDEKNVKVTSKECNDYCGLQSKGSIDGVYTRTR